MSQIVSSRASHPVASAFGGFAAGVFGVIAVRATHGGLGPVAAALVAGALVALLSTPLGSATRSERAGAVIGFVTALVFLGALVAALAVALSNAQFG